MTNDDQKDLGNQTVITAAGGILERLTPKGPEIALIYREIYGSEWSLPKGKLKENETWAQAALREVKEETGCDAHIRRFADVSHYIADKTPKLVLYWTMDIIKECAFEPSDEVKKIEWVSPHEAVRRLTHEDQRRLVEKIYFKDEITSKRSKISIVRGVIAHIIAPRRWRRLASSISTYREELSCMNNRSALSDCKDMSACSNLLDMAEKALTDGEIDMGWKHFLAAVRMEVLSIDTVRNKEQIKSKVITLRKEVSKLKTWRKESAEKLLGEGDYEPPGENIYQAMFIRDEHYSNQAYKSALMRNYLIGLAIIMSLLVACFLWMMKGGCIPTELIVKDQTPNDQFDTLNYQFYFAITLFGLLGGTMSAILSVPRSVEHTRIPELTTTIRVTMLRLVLGVGSALIITVFIKSGLIGMFNTGIASMGKNITPYTFYAIAFVSGTSERLVLKAVEYVAGK